MEAIKQTPSELSAVDLSENTSTTTQNNGNYNDITTNATTVDTSTPKTSTPRSERKVRFAPEEIQICVEPTSNNNLEVVESEATTAQTMWLYLSFVAIKVYSGLEFLGEKLADLFGITESRYQYVLDEYNRIEEEKAKKLKRQIEKQEQEMRNLEGGDSCITTSTGTQ
eukprot:TRINITY_DN1185_c0_g1_i1.p1 TRINITY_DN1185_c0_g1~~TRINITY_DN1185_c0_g1_i1.p1  ORF type:complete len:168 (-),score=46.56 TRINITY_DN1185_c0_g1_i1:125-628(-)